MALVNASSTWLHEIIAALTRMPDVEHGEAVKMAFAPTGPNPFLPWDPAYQAVIMLRLVHDLRFSQYMMFTRMDDLGCENYQFAHTPAGCAPDIDSADIGTWFAKHAAARKLLHERGFTDADIDECLAD